MKKRSVLLLTAVVLWLARPLAADEPPSFEPFESKSKNGRFVAVVEPEHDQWKLTVFEIRAGERVEKWSCGYRYSGYPGAWVSDDGQSVIYLEVWFYEDRSVLDFYHQGQLVRQVHGRDIPFDRSKLMQTASHQLWLDEQGIHAELDGQGRLVFRTIDGRRQRFDVATGKPTD